MMALSFFLISLLLLLAPAVLVLGQPGFLSIDCGLGDNYGAYKDPITGIDYVPDGPYIDTGENHRIAPEVAKDYNREYQTLRSFPSGKRNCYALPTVVGTKYMVRAFILYGNYDGKDSSSLSFDLHLGATFWVTVLPNDVYEAIFIASAAWTPVCLVDTGSGTPFVNVLDLRPLGSALYSDPLVTRAGMMMSMYDRRHMGASRSSIRYDTSSES